MGLSLATVGGKITAALFNAVVGQVNSGGLQLVKPSTVAGTGVTVTTLGKVAFTATTSITVNGIFSTTYDQYLLLLDVPTAVTPAALTMTLASSGVPDSSANYDTEVLSATGATATAGQALAFTNVPLSATTTGTSHTFKIELFRPALALPTNGLVEAFSTANPGTSTTTGTQSRAFQHRIATSYDGVQIVSGNQITGTLRVYGYNNG